MLEHIEGLTLVYNNQAARPVYRDGSNGSHLFINIKLVRARLQAEARTDRVEPDA